MYCGISESSSCSAFVYLSFPLPPGTSLSWTPPSSLYCCQKSVSRVSSAERKRRMAASPGVRPPLAPARVGTPLTKRAVPMAPAPPTASPLRKKERRLVACCDGCPVCAMICPFCVFCAMIFSSSCLSMDQRRTSLDLCTPSTTDAHHLWGIHSFGKVILVLGSACSLPDQVLLRTICQKVLRSSLKECSSVLYLPL